MISEFITFPYIILSTIADYVIILILVIAILLTMQILRRKL
jgi:hypothetical protein